ncbi:hypothetical protein [Roseibium aggregatum]|uniref:Uncharacterized protein n=1 Tax=Roseibium aggregatum TaxID=187304 RepID=A0A939ED70_9HYPH|nr:hypothetical protein [Roseibium aggregatum]MBN9670803.1 hypothetical protein [Roseibium aggregatum]
MWAMLAVSIQMLSGPNVWVVTNEGTFESAQACEAALSEAVPRTLSEDLRLAWEAGELKYVCLKVRGTEPAPN